MFSHIAGSTMRSALLPSLSMLSQELVLGLRQASALLAPMSLPAQQPENAQALSSQARYLSSSSRAAEQAVGAGPAVHQQQAGAGSSGAGPSTASASSTSTSGQASLPSASSLMLGSRYLDYYRTVLYRELMLKRGVAKYWDEGVPQLDSITLSIRLPDTRLDYAKDAVEKWQLLLHMLALEYISGKPAEFLPVPGKAIAEKASGVIATLHGPSMYNFLEKLVYAVLPNQIGFEGVQQPVNAAEAAAATTARKASRAQAAELEWTGTKKGGVAPPRVDKEQLALQQTWSVDLKITNMMLFPEFEQEFELFEPLQSMTVSVRVKNTRSAEDCLMLLEGLGLPRSHAAAPPAAVAAAPAAAAAPAPADAPAPAAAAASAAAAPAAAAPAASAGKGSAKGGK